jgi:hypothetical protein
MVLSVEAAIKVTRRTTAAKLGPALVQIKLPEKPASKVSYGSFHTAAEPVVDIEMGKGGFEAWTGSGRSEHMTEFDVVGQSSPTMAAPSPAPPAPPISSGDDFIAGTQDALKQMDPAIQKIVADDERQMKLALAFAVVLLAVGVGVIIFSAYGGKLDQTLLGAVVSGVFTAPYWKYDQIRKEKAAYTFLVPSMLPQLAECKGEKTDDAKISCCSKTLDSLTKLRESLIKIAGSSTPPQDQGKASGSGTSGQAKTSG